MLDNLYKNIGGKIKIWAQWLFVIEAIASIIFGIAMIAEDVERIAIGLLIIFFGPVVAFVSTWILYAFGELVESVVAIRQKFAPDTDKPTPDADDEGEYADDTSELEQLLNTLNSQNDKKTTVKTTPIRPDSYALRCDFCGASDRPLKAYKTQSTIGVGYAKYTLCEKCARKNNFI